MPDQKKPAPADSSAPALESTVVEPSPTAQLAALAAAGSFVEQRVSRGQHANGEREASDQIMERITELLAQ